MYDPYSEPQFVLWDARPGEIIRYNGSDHRVGATWPNYVVFYETTDEIVYAGTMSVAMPCFAVSYNDLKAAGAYYVTRVCMINAPIKTQTLSAARH